MSVTDAPLFPYGMEYNLTEVITFLAKINVMITLKNFLASFYFLSNSPPVKNKALHSMLYIM
jgi:hypothetical protein